MKFEVEEHEASRIISALAMQDSLIAKLSGQVTAQRRGNGHAAEGLGERPDPGTDPPRQQEEAAPPDRSDSPQQRQARPAKKQARPAMTGEKP